MWPVEYYTRPDGSQPAREWISEQVGSIRASIYARIERLKENGLLLVINGVWLPILIEKKAILSCFADGVNIVEYK